MTHGINLRRGELVSKKLQTPGTEFRVWVPKNSLPGFGQSRARQEGLEMTMHSDIACFGAGGKVGYPLPTHPSLLQPCTCRAGEERSSNSIRILQDQYLHGHPTFCWWLILTQSTPHLQSH